MTWCNKFGIHYLFNDVPISLLSILILCIILYEHSCLYLLNYMWLRCIKSYIGDLSHGFLTNKWLVHNHFMGLGNPLEVIVHHLLIGGMIGLGYRDRFPMVSALVCMVTHWIRPMMSHDLRLSSSHDFTKLCCLSTLREYWVRAKVKSGFNLWWKHKLITYSL